MIVVAGAILVVLGAISAVHVYWALGGLWPARTEQDLVKMVIGSASSARMPPRWLTVIVAALILLAGLLPAVHLTGWVAGPATRYLLVAAAGVFLLRGAVPYLVPSLAGKMSEPFRSLNARYFSPLCLLLGAGFLAVSL